MLQYTAKVEPARPAVARSAVIKTSSFLQTTTHAHCADEFNVNSNKMTLPAVSGARQNAGQLTWLQSETCSWNEFFRVIGVQDSGQKMIV